MLWEMMLQSTFQTEQLCEFSVWLKQWGVLVIGPQDVAGKSCALNKDMVVIRPSSPAV